MATDSTLRFSAHTDELTSLLRIVNMVRTGDANTRPEIARLTGLGRGVVSQRVDRAIETGFLEDGELGRSSGGRVPRTLLFRATRGRIIVCALGVMHMRVGLADLNGSITDHHSVEWEISRGPTETIETAIGLIDNLLAKADDVPTWGVVVGLPGPVDFASGRPMAPPIMPGWSGFDVRGRFEGQFAAPVWVDNDVNLLALSERARRRGQAIDLIYCKIGTGVGAGLLSEGRLHRGANGSAGAIGHVPVPGSELPCRCGKIGCLEARVGGWALVRDAHQAIANGVTGHLADAIAAQEPITPARIARAAGDGDGLAVSLIQQSARSAGDAISALVNMFNPSVIVLGGAIALADELFLAEVRQRVYEQSLPLATKGLSIISAVNDVCEPLRGGAELAIEQLFEVTFARWFAEGQPTTAAMRHRTDEVTSQQT